MAQTEETHAFSVTGMTCQNCVNHVEKALRSTPGVLDAKVNLKKGSAEVRARPGASKGAMVHMVKEAGYGLQEATPMDASGSRWRLWKR